MKLKGCHLLGAWSIFAMSLAGCKFNKKTVQGEVKTASSADDPCVVTTGADGRFVGARGDVLPQTTPLAIAAWRYSCYVQHFNTTETKVGGRPPVPLAEVYPIRNSTSGRPSSSLFGEMPYWELPLGTLPGGGSLELLKAGEDSIAGTLLDAGAGKVRVFGHYLDGESRSALKRKLGEPTGTMPAYVQSSLRTVLVIPPNAPPAFVKMSGDGLVKELDKAPPPNADGEGAAVDESAARRSRILRLGWYKFLDRPEVINSVVRGGKYIKTPGYVVDTAGLLVDGIERKVRMEGPLAEERASTYHVLYRPFPLGEGLGKVPFVDGDFMLAAHSLFSRAFLQTALGKKILGNNPREWLERTFMPELGRFLVRPLYSSGLHTEVHGQNVDFLFDAQGRLKASFVKDVVDAADDPLMNLLRGATGKDLTPPKFEAIDYMHRADTFKNYRDAELPVCSEDWYRSYLGLLLNSIAVVFPDVGFNGVMSLASKAIAEAIQNFSAEAGWNRDAISALAEVGALSSGTDIKSTDVLGRYLRDAYVKPLLAAQFVRNADQNESRKAVQAGIKAGQAYMGGTTAGVCVTRVNPEGVPTRGLPSSQISLNGVEFGKVSGAYAAVKRSANGAIEDYIVIIPDAK